MFHLHLKISQHLVGVLIHKMWIEPNPGIS